MKRGLLSALVAALVLSASGAFAISWTDPCEDEVASTPGEDQSCPPTCFTCGCCSQAIEPPCLDAVPAAEPIAHAEPPSSPGFTNLEPRGILHVPKTLV